MRYFDKSSSRTYDGAQKIIYLVELFFAILF